MSNGAALSDERPVTAPADRHSLELPPDLKSAPSEAWIGDVRSRFLVEPTIDALLTRKLRNRGGPRHTPLQPHDVSDRLQRFLGRRLSGPFEISGLRGLTGGGSKEQFQFELSWRDAQTGDRHGKYVLRMEPPESIVETDRQREFDVIRGLANSRVPVPIVMWCDPTGEELGQPSFIMEYVEGITKPPAQTAEATGAGPKQGFNRHYRELVSSRFVQVIADIHSYDWRLAQVDSLGDPREGTTDALLWQIEWWRRVWEEDSLQPLPIVSYVGQWLVDNAPPIDRLSLVHGDLRAGNFLFDADSGSISAMLDWELVHVGDRHEDLAYTLSPLFSEMDEDGKTVVGGLWEAGQFETEYVNRSGLDINADTLRYYRVFNGWRCCIIALGTGVRVALAGRNHQSLLSGWLGATGPIMAQEMLTGIRGL